eukprot:CAMPEP_0198711384 /NCGR_PEP_ID=MMETSP1471-20131121/3478_1 /TAXON_ID=41880 /ORGANISM="Pycnococcus provasolii, Strain RCC733" /LENGTH=361 /DNA_ID=CAMNT_0044471199 /DNA_START=273 /DNA_END=1358 /DNA_ORIENTATION=+
MRMMNGNVRRGGAATTASTSPRTATAHAHASHATTIFTLSFDGEATTGDSFQSQTHVQSQTLMQRLALQQITKLLDQTMLKPAETNMCHSLIELLQQLPNATISAVYEHFGNNNVPCTLVTALGGGGDYLRTLRWTFIEVDVPQTSSRIVVEPRFRESFDVAHPTPLLKKILNAIPEVFVGSTARLRTLVGVLSEHIRLSFHAQGLNVPPWRHEIATTSKWFPQPSRCRRVSWAQPIRETHAVHAECVASGAPQAILDSVENAANQSAVIVPANLNGVAELAGPLADAMRKANVEASMATATSAYITFAALRAAASRLMMESDSDYHDDKVDGAFELGARAVKRAEGKACLSLSETLSSMM